VFGGNEISRAQARGFIGMLRQLALKHGIAVILLGHPSLSGISSNSGDSGSTHWRNAVRAGVHLRRPDDPDAHPDLRVLEVTKNNYGAPGLQLTIRWTAGAFEVEGEGAPSNREEAALKVDGTFLRLLTTYNAQGRRVSDQSGTNYAPYVFAKDPGREGATRAGLMAAMMRLFAAGKIEVEQVGPPSKLRRQLIITRPSGQP
jgi:RecA-family ATPase